MNRPDFLQFLTKGKILSSRVFPKFVDTWNWLVSAFDSFVGDANLNPEEGFVFVDRTDRSRPILRLVNTHKLGSGEGGGGDTTPKMFEPKFSDDGTLTSVGSGFIPFGRSFYWKKSPSVSAASQAYAKGLATLRINHPTETSQLSCEIVVMGNYTKDSADGYLTSSTYGYSTIPLYFFENGEITLDCRYLLSLSVREIG